MSERVISKVLVVALVLSFSGSISLAIDSTWLCGNGNYSNTSCWDPLLGVPPCNYGPVTFDVTVPAGSSTVSMNTGTCEVSSFILGADRTFQVRAGNSYSVIGQADMYGHIWGNGGDFIAPVATILGNKARFTADNGAAVVIGADSYTTTGYIDTWGEWPTTRTHYKDLIVVMEMIQILTCAMLSA